MAEALYGLGHVARKHDDLDRAAALWKESLRRHREGGRQRYVAWCLMALAGLSGPDSQLRSQLEAEQAARLFGAAAALPDTVRARMLPPDRADYDHRMSTVRAILGETGFATAWAEGQAMPLDQAIAEALEQGA